MRLALLGETMDVVTPPEIFEFIGARIRAGKKAIIANHNLHSLSLMDRPSMQTFFHMADMVMIDSMPLVAWAKLLRLPVSRENRCTYLDYRDQFWATVFERDWRVFFVGGAPGVAERGMHNIERDHAVDIAVHHGFFDMDGPENDALVAQINEFKPDIIMVGMGMPRQEQWIVQNIDRLNQGVLMSVGAAFDYEAGVQKAAPRWMGRFGMEWAYRLVADPGRLFTRYVIEPWILMPRLVADLVQRRRFTDRRQATP